MSKSKGMKKAAWRIHGGYRDMRPDIDRRKVARLDSGGLFNGCQ